MSDRMRNALFTIWFGFTTLVTLAVLCDEQTMRLVTLALVLVPAAVWFVREYRQTPEAVSEWVDVFDTDTWGKDGWVWPGDVIAEEHAAYAAALAAELDDRAAVARWLGVS